MEKMDGNLIELVARFPYLYDRANVNFKNKIAKENAWKNIGMILKERPNNCETRWGVLRCKYTAMKRAISSDSPSAPKNWELFDHMKFLDPFVKRRLCKYRKDPKLNKLEIQPHVNTWKRLRVIQPAEDKPILPKAENIEIEDIDIEETMIDFMESSQSASTESEQASTIPSSTTLDMSGLFEKYNHSTNNKTDDLSRVQRVSNDIDMEEEELFAKQIVMDLRKVKTEKDRMFIKREIYNVFYQYFENNMR